MKRYWMVLIGLLSMVLISCSTPAPVLLGGCVIPEALDYEAQGPKQLDATKPLPPNDAVGFWALDRKSLAGLARDYNDLRNHCKSNP